MRDQLTTSNRDIQMANGSTITLAGDGEPLRGLPDAVFIRLDPHEVECIACGAVHVKAQGLPMYEGWFLEANDPGEWAGFDACRPCFDAYTAGGIQGLMQHLSELRDSARAHSLVRTYEELCGPTVRRSICPP